MALAVFDCCLTYLHALPETALKDAPPERLFDLLAYAEEEAEEWKRRERRFQ